MPRISLIHATPLAVQPVNDAFSLEWPEAQVVNLLEDSLAPDLSEAGQLTDSMKERFERLALYAKETGANGILFTCSAFGPAIEQAAARVAPLLTLKPNVAMFAQAIRSYKQVGLIATFGPSLPSMEAEFKKMANVAGSQTKLESVLAKGALEALTSGDHQTHNQIIAESAASLAHCDAIMLAQFSMAEAKAEIEKSYKKPVLTSPSSAILALKSRLLDEGAR